MKATIGLIITSLAHPWTRLQWQGVKEGTRSRDANLVCFTGGYLLARNGNDAQANIIYDFARSERLDGLLLWGGGLNSFVDPDEMEVFAARYRPTPIVSVEHPIAGIPSVLSDDYGAMRDLMTHLITVHGYRRIAYIQSVSNFHVGLSARYRAYVETLAAYGIPFDPDLVSPPFYFETHENSPTLSDWLQQLRLFEKAAIVGHNDMAALSTLEVIQSLGMNVPRDIALAGFDDVEESRSVTPPLTTVHPPFYEMGKKAVEVLFDMLEGKSVAEITRLATPLVVRRSCGCEDHSMVWAAVGPKERGEAVVESLDARRELIISAVGETVDAAALEEGQLERLLDGFLGDLLGDAEKRFLLEMEETLYQDLRSGSDIMAWQDAISTIRRLAIPHLGTETLAKAEDLLQQARVMIASAARRQLIAASQRAVGRLDVLRSIQGELITTFDTDALMDSLFENLPRIGVKGCYLSLYVKPQPYHYPLSAPELSRLILAFDTRGRIDLGKDAAPFPSRLLVPDGLWPEDRSFLFSAEPIYFQRDQIGFVLFEIGGEEVTVYETLRGLISSALEGALLMIKERRRGNQLRAAALVSRATSSILDSDDMVKRVVNLISEYFCLAHTELFLVDEATGSATFRSASTKAEGSQGESDSLVDACVKDARSRIALGAASDATAFLSSDRVAMALPLASRGRVIGALSVRCASGEAFDDDEVKVLQTLSDQIANAFENVRLFDAYKRAEGDLKDERNLLRTIIDEIPEYIYVKDTASRFLLSNRGFTSNEGVRSPEELLGKTDHDFFEPALADEYRAEEKRIMEEGASLLDHEHCRLDADGNDLWIQTSKVPLRDSRGAVIGLVGVSRNITDRKRGEEALRQQSMRLQTALDVAGTVNALLDVGRILECVAALIREKFGFYCVGIFLVEESGEEAALRASRGAASMNDGPGTVRFDLGGKSMIGFAARSSAPRIAQDVSADPLYVPSPHLPDTRSEAAFPMLIGDAPIGVLDVQSDRIGAFTQDVITILKTMAYQIAIAVQNARLHADEQERSRELDEAYKALKENQERSLISEKMASLGRLTAGIAHEINTPIAALRSALVEIGKLTDEYELSIGDASVTAQDHGEIVSELKASLRLANAAAERAAGFVKGIKTQTLNMGQVKAQRFDAVSAIKDALLLLGHALLKAKCGFAFRPTDDRIDLIGSPGRLAQVVTNLVTNAIDACSGTAAPMIIIDLVRLPDRIELRVTDNGTGIPGENLSKIFDPLFTTKAIGQGTGLGLTIVHDIVVGEFGGKIEVKSALGEGSAFTLQFPHPPATHAQ